MQDLFNLLLNTGEFENISYLQNYVDLIVANKETKATKFKTQKHHIIPRCYFKIKQQEVDNSTQNIVNLRFIDHVRAHCFLILAAKPKSLFQYYNFCAVNHLTGKLYLEFSTEEILEIEQLYQSEEYQQSYEAGRIATSINNPMKTNQQAYDNQVRLMKSTEMRAKISKTLKELRTTIGFSAEHKQKIAESRQKRKEERAAQGLKFYDDCSHCDTRSLGVYCILNTGEKYEFHSIKEAGKWWYDTYKPFGSIYSTATYQRKIESSIAGKEIEYGNKTTKKYIKITNIKWFFTNKGGDINEVN